MASVGDLTRSLVLSLKSNTTAFRLDSVAKELDSVSSAADQMATRTRTAFTKTARESKSKAREMGRETGAELAQNLGEAISQGGGTIGQTLLSTVGGLATAFGPAGWVGAGIIGGLVLVWSKAEADAKAAFDRVDRLWGQLDPLGNLDATAARTEVLMDLGAGSQAKGLAEVSKQARAAGVSVQVMLDYMSGLPVSAENARLLRDQLNETSKIPGFKHFKEVPSEASKAEKSAEAMRMKLLEAAAAAKEVDRSIRAIPSRRNVAVVVTTVAGNRRLPTAAQL